LKIFLLNLPAQFCAIVVELVVVVEVIGDSVSIENKNEWNIEREK